MKHHHPFRLSLLALAVAAACSSAFAQTAPDAGHTLREQAPALEAPKPSPGISIETPAPSAVQPGGAQVALQSVSFHGNTLFSQEQLMAVLGNVTGKSYDMAGLKNLAERISEFYRQAGYPFARAYLPPQNLQGGALRIDVVEGRYGQVTAHGDAALAPQAQEFLAPLKPGEVIESTQLERATLILDDQPGVHAIPLIKPGQQVGTGDLDVRVERTPRYTGEAGIDNHGNRYTGQTQAHFNLEANSPFMLGDQIVLRTLYTEEHMWFGNLGYSLPLGTSGLRGQVSYAHTYYQLGKDFASLDATGTANVSSVGLSYPIVRSRQANLNLSAAVQHKALNDRAGAASTSSDKASNTMPLTLGFDVRDGFGGGAVSYGALAWTNGHLMLDSALATADSASAKSAGKFQKINLDLARIQAVSERVSLFGRLSAQWAGKNLDSSEEFGLGGPGDVRAYPVGEAYGDEGWLLQAEARYATGPYTLYGFYDAGGVKVNVEPWAAGTNRRSIAGTGGGVRCQLGHWNLDASLAWRTHGGAPQSDTRDRNPAAWFSASYKF